MSTKTSAAALMQAAKNLSAEWQQAKEHWTDVKSRQFEKDHLERLPDEISRAMTVMNDLDLLLNKVRRDCE